MDGHTHGSIDYYNMGDDTYGSIDYSAGDTDDSSMVDGIGDGSMVDRIRDGKAEQGHSRRNLMKLLYPKKLP
jgi:hypothetical protein